MPESTQMPTSALRNARPSLVPSPMNPQIWFCFWRVDTIAIFCWGVTCTGKVFGYQITFHVPFVHYHVLGIHLEDQGE